MRTSDWIYTLAAVVALALASWFAWTTFGARSAPQPAPAAVVTPAEDLAAQALAEAQAERLRREQGQTEALEAERLRRERDQALQAAREQERQLALERARIAAQQQAAQAPPAPRTPSAAGVWDGTLPSGDYVWTLRADGTFATPNSNGRWYQNGRAVSLVYSRPEGWRTELTLDGDRMSGYEVRPDGSRGSNMTARRR